ncbi:MAG: YXWGXW repeat-containing protein [Acidobacteriia bacterium]|nr:YXWGXW repeat-containing protein [Terriglobia bacterium]
MKQRFLAPLALVGGALLSACAAPGAVVVRYGPPPPRYAVVGVAPGPGYVWTEGFWDWRGGNYVWVQGRWLRPPRPRAVWIPGGWVERPRHGYVFRRGHWR